MTDFQTADMFSDFGVHGIASHADIATPARLGRPVSHMSATKQQMKRLERKASAAEILDAIPAPGETLRIVSNGGFDFWDLVPTTVALLGEPCIMHACTWILNRTIAVELFDLIDAGKISGCTLVTGDYFRQRTPDAYGIIAQGFTERGMRFRTAAVHAKVMLIESESASIVFEGSANWTNNTNVEQFSVTNHRDVLAFHRDWIEEIANG